MAKYQYQPLPGDDFIRLVTIHPAAFENDVVVTIEAVAFDDSSPQYEALSYTWGSEDDPGTIQVGTAGLSVTQNLLCAFKHLRRDTEPRVMWIDAVCIDQAGNEKENGLQVARMGDIFHQASHVVAWIGPADEQHCSDEAMRLMDRIGSQIEVNWHYASMRPAPECADPRIAERSASWPPYLDFDHTGDYILQLLGRPWFTRLWIRQEIFLAKHATICCGASEVSWEAFRKAFVCLWYKPVSSSLRRLLDLELKGLIWQLSKAILPT